MGESVPGTTGTPETKMSRVRKIFLAVESKKKKKKNSAPCVINSITRSDLVLQHKRKVIYGPQQQEDTVKTTEEELHFSLFLQQPMEIFFFSNDSRRLTTKTNMAIRAALGPNVLHQGKVNINKHFTFFILHDSRRTNANNLASVY